jgi:hypothetical protein
MKRLVAISAVLASAWVSGAAYADAVSQATRMHRRLTGLNPSTATLDKMVKAIKSNDPNTAAMAAIDSDEQSAFYNYVAKSFISRDFDEDGNLTPLSDGIALFVAMTRDDIDFRYWLFGNMTAIGDAKWDHAIYDDPYQKNGGLPDPIPAVAVDSNRHYEQMEARGVDLKKHLVIIKQTDTLVDPTQMWAGHADTVPAGVLTTRAWASMYYNAGTNRAPIRFMLKLYLGEDIDYWHDTTIPDNEVRRDPSRAPGGDPAVYVNKCKGCHAGMDPMSRAFAYVDWDDVARKIKFTKPLKTDPSVACPVRNNNNQPEPALHSCIQCALNPEVTLSASSSYEDKLRCAVVTKYMNNKDTYANGYAVVNDHWMNQWTVGQNSRAGWPTKYGEKIYGDGPKQLGLMFAQSKQFARAMSKRVYQYVCLVNDFSNQVVEDKLTRLTDDFVKGGYKMKSLFAEAATQCMGD